MNSYIFITTEGHTYQPDSEAAEPDIENCQVIGFAQGSNSKQAFENLIEESPYLLQTAFDQLICYELKHRDYHSDADYFYLSNSTANSIS